MDADTLKRIQRKTVREWHSKLAFVSCCLTMFLHTGFFFSIGSLFTDVMAEFNSSRAETAFIQSTAMTVANCLGLLIGALTKKLGVVMTGIFGSVVVSVSLAVCFFASSLMYLIIAVGVFCGFGICCLYISSSAAVSQHFSGRRQLLFLSIHASSTGVGGMVFPYLLEYLSDVFGIRGTLLIIAAVNLNTIPLCFLWKRQKITDKLQEHSSTRKQIREFETRMQVETKDSGENITIEKMKQGSEEESDSVYVSQYPVLQGETRTKTVTVQSTWHQPTYLNKTEMGQTTSAKTRQLLSNKCFIIFVLGMIFLMPSLNLIIIFVADIFQDNELTNSDVSLGMLLINAMSIVGRLVPGMMLQSRYISLLSVPILSAVLNSVIIFLFTFVKSRWLIIVLSGAFGIPLGMCLSVFNVVSLKLVGSDMLPIAIGMFFTINGVGLFASGPVSGYIRDVTGSYTAIFYASSAASLAAAAIFLGAHALRRKEKSGVKRRSSVFYLTSF